MASSPADDPPFLNRRARIALQLFRHQFCMRDAKTKIALSIVKLDQLILQARFPGLVCRTIAWILDDFYIGFRACVIHTDALSAFYVTESKTVAPPFDSPALIGGLVIATREGADLFAIVFAGAVYTDASV
jgi:hypothetical protein